MYEEGDGVDQSSEEAVSWYLMAAKKGNSCAISNLINMVEHGDENASRNIRYLVENKFEGVISELESHIKYNCYDNSIAFNMLRLVAEQGDAEAQYSLAGILADRDKNQSLDDAIDWYRLSAEQGHNNALSALMHLAYQGSVKAQYSLGWIYDINESIGESSVEAVRWYAMAASNGDNKSLCCLRLMSEEGNKYAKNALNNINK